MNSYEVFIEDINPCGGEAHSRKEVVEIEAESPMSWVESNKRFPVIDVTDMENGDVIITTGDAKGYIVRYTFSM